MSAVFRKDQEIALNDLGGSSPILVFALRWLNKPKSGILNKLTGKHYDADLDLSCVIYDKEGDRIDCVWYAQRASKDGAIRHSGDDTVGWREGDDETITLDLNQLVDTAYTLFFVISSFSGDKFSHVENPSWRLLDAQTKNEVGHYDISPSDKTTAKIVMRLQKTVKDGLSEWSVKALDEPATGQNIQEIFPEIRSLIEA